MLFGKQAALRRFTPSARIDYILVSGNEWVNLRLPLLRGHHGRANRSRRSDTLTIRCATPSFGILKPSLRHTKGLNRFVPIASAAEIERVLDAAERIAENGARHNGRAARRHADHPRHGEALRNDVEAVADAVGRGDAPRGQS